jgi:lipopolysaccharide cholinephosphotransferase
LKKLTLEEIKKIELEILCYFADFCEKNSLRYYLAGGTLLGAIRHQGFIPWDDDIDVIMPRPDYMRFISLFKLHEEKVIYKIFSPYDSNNVYPYTKIFDSRTIIYEKYIDSKKKASYGVFIDVFPIDGLPNNDGEINIYFLFQKILSKLLWILNTGEINIKKKDLKIRGLPFREIICRILIRIIDKFAMRYDFDKARLIAVSVISTHGKREIIEKAKYITPIKVNFEGKLFNAPQGYNLYLRNLYGNYMRLPPIEDRKSNHSFEAYLR